MISKTEQDIMCNWDLDAKQPLVSICCIAYNHGDFIAESIDSYLMQKTNFPFEVIIRDDASTDGTQAIASSYKKQFPTIIKLILEKENQYSKGIAPFAVALKEAKGQYIAVCEGDDYWTDETKLQQQFNHLESNPNLSMSFHNVKVVDTYNAKKTKLFCTLDREVYSTVDVINGWFIPTPAMFFKKSCLDDTPSSLRDVFNGDLSVQLLCSTYGDIGYLNTVMAVYRKHPNSLSITSFNQDPTFAYRRLISLLDIFDDFSQGEFSDAITQKKIAIHKVIADIEFKSKNVLFYYILHPILFSIHLSGWFGSKIRKKMLK